MNCFYLMIRFTLAVFPAADQPDSTHINQLLDKAYGYEVSRPQEALDTYREAYQLSIRKKYMIGAFKALQYSGLVHSGNGRYDSALVYYSRSLPYSRKSSYRRGEAVTYINMANAHQFMGNYGKAVPLYLAGIKIFEHLKDSSTVSQSYKNLSALYATIKNLSLEEFYIKKTIQFLNKADKEKIGLLYGDYGLYYIKQNKFKEALAYFKKAADLSKADSSHALSLFSTRNFGEYYNHSKNYRQAIPYYEQALALTTHLNDVFQKNDLLYILSGLYEAINDHQKALDYGLQSYRLAKEIQAKEILYRSQKRLSGIYHRLGQAEKAYDFLENSYSLKDSILNENHLKQISFMQTQFETEKKDKSIAEQQVKLKEQEVELLAKRNQTSISLIALSFLLLLSLGSWLYFRQRQREKNKQILAMKQQQEIAQLEALIDGEEKERRRIAQELHDGINGELSAIKFRLSSLEEAGLGKEDHKNLLKTIEMVDSSCAQIRSISHNLMPSSILDFGLVDTIREYCSKINQAHPLQLEFQYFGDPAVLPGNVETVIYRIVQELINNMIKHAQATMGLVQLNFHQHELFITVEDNGTGFDPQAVQKGLGLKNIHSRINFLNAQLEINSHQQGTSFHIAIDLNSLKND